MVALVGRLPVDLSKGLPHLMQEVGMIVWTLLIHQTGVSFGATKFHHSRILNGVQLTVLAYIG